MGRTFKLLLVALLGALVLAACGQQPITAEEVVEKMEAARAAMQDAHATIAIDFVTDQENGNLLIETWMKKPAGQDGTEVKPKVRAVVREASEAKMVGSELVSDGETFWLYNPSEKRAITGKAEEMQENAPSDPMGMSEALQEAIQRGLDMVDIEVLGEEQVAGQNTWKLRLTPKPETSESLQLADVVEAIMWVNEENALPLKLSVDAKDAGRGTVEVRSLELNTNLSDEIFTFTPPEGTEVVQAAELAEKYQPRQVTLDEARAAVSFPVLTPETLPGDAVLVEVRLIGDHTVIQNFAGPAANLSLVQSITDTGAEREPPAGSEVSQVTVRGQPATLITGGAGRQGSLLRWREGEVRLVIAGTITAEQAIATAEALK